MQHHRAARRFLGSVALVLTLTACTPVEIAAWQHHLDEEQQRYGAGPHAAVVQAFTDAGIPDRADEAWRVAAGPASCGSTGESGGNPTARNGGHYGLFQIAQRWHAARAQRLGLTWERVAVEAYANARLAADLVLEQGWRPWSCRP